jgi:hypothetical protein
MARWSGTWNPLGCAASIGATSRPDKTPLARRSYSKAPVITNPPYDTERKRELMHALILHFMRAAPFVRLLIDYDWSATKQATPFMRHCTDVVVLPRLKWIADTKNTGKDNHAWYRFAAGHTAGPILHAWHSAPMSSRASQCAECGKPYWPQRSDSRFCGDTCRQRAHRAGLVVTSRD